MTTMLDKMAEALYVADCRFANGLGMQDVAFPPWAAVSYSIRARFHDAARAALQAIRDAGPAMIEAGMDGCGPVGCCNIEQDNVREVWTAMIDEALKGE